MRLNQIAVDRGEGYVNLSLEEYFALPLVDRIQMLLNKRMRFYDESANLIPLSDGVRLLRECQQPAVPSQKNH
jgi:hypothetical protein